MLYGKLPAFVLKAKSFVRFAHEQLKASCALLPLKGKALSAMGEAHPDFGLTTYHDLYLGSDGGMGSGCSDVVEHTPSTPFSKKAVPPSSRSGKRLSLQVSSELHRDLKLLAMEEEETMNSLIVSVLRQYLKDRNNFFRKKF